MSQPVRIGLHSGQQYASFEEIAALWSRAEDVGLDWISLFDHVRPPLGGVAGPCLEPLTTLSALACRTARVRCAILVASPAWRHPAMLAASLLTIDHVSGGRAELGLGVGGMDLGYQQFGIAPPGLHRYEILDEYCAVVSGLLSGAEVTYQGNYFSLRHARLVPGPVQPSIPLTIGASGERRGLRLVARWADTWNTLAGSVGTYRRKCDALDRWCEVEGQDPSRIRRSITFRTVLAPTSKRTVAKRERLRDALGEDHPDLCEHLDVDSVGELVDLLGRYRELGATDFLLGLRPPLDEETLVVFATEVAPQLRDSETGPFGG